MIVIPLHLKQANEFVQKYHRHSIPTVGGKFAIGASLQNQLVGVAIAGRPVARGMDDGKTLEILRVCTDGSPNACSFLYGRVARIAKLLGYSCVITYTLDSESGSSLRAIGALPDGEIKAREWTTPSRPRKSQSVYLEKKIRWKLQLCGGKL